MQSAYLSGIRLKISPSSTIHNRASRVVSAQSMKTDPSNKDDGKLKKALQAKPLFKNKTVTNYFITNFGVVLEVALFDITLHYSTRYIHCITIYGNYSKPSAESVRKA
jgi:hypothetical protein